MEKKKKFRAPTMKIATNLALAVLLLSVGALAIAPMDEDVSVKGDSWEIYRSAGENGVGVSLMFNVYWGTEEVYKILDVLSENQAQATFFIGGCWADDNVQCLRDIFAGGHEIGNHGYFHKDHDKLSFSDNRKEIVNCNRFIELSVGEKPILFAPPSGAYGENTLSVCKALGMKTVLWSKDTIDWRDKDENLIYTRATQGVKKGDFILMHPMVETANVLDKILKYYRENSLEIVTVSENLQEKG